MNAVRPAQRRRRARGAALISAVAVLVVVAAFAALFLSVHSTQVTTTELAVCRLRAEAAALAATHLTLWKLNQDADQQQALARVVYERDTAFDADPLFQTDGDLAGATFHVDLWPGADTVRLKTVAQCGGVYFQRWAQMPIRLETATNLLACGDFEDPTRIVSSPYWGGVSSLGLWLAGYGITRVDDPHDEGAANPWNITRDGTNHFAEELRSSSTLAQYVSSQGAAGTLSLAFDYIRRNGNYSVKVRGADTLPAAGTLYPGQSSYQRWTDAGVLLYDSGNLLHATRWTHFQADVPAGNGYAYYVVEVVAVGGGSTPDTPERAVDNMVLRPAH